MLQQFLRVKVSGHYDENSRSRETDAGEWVRSALRGAGRRRFSEAEVAEPRSPACLGRYQNRIIRRLTPQCKSPSGDGNSENGSSPPAAFSEAEPKPNRRIDRTPIEEAVRQATIDLREHDPGVGIELLRKLPIGDERNGVLGPMAV